MPQRGEGDGFCKAHLSLRWGAFCVGNDSVRKEMLELVRNVNEKSLLILC